MTIRSRKARTYPHGAGTVRGLALRRCGVQLSAGDTLVLHTDAVTEAGRLRKNSVWTRFLSFSHDRDEGLSVLEAPGRALAKACKYTLTLWTGSPGFWNIPN
jgi:hypothetical protein